MPVRVDGYRGTFQREIGQPLKTPLIRSKSSVELPIEVVFEPLKDERSPHVHLTEDYQHQDTNEDVAV